MKQHKAFTLLTVAPFGAETDEGDNGATVGDSAGSVATQSNSGSGAAGASTASPAVTQAKGARDSGDSEDDDEYKDLTPRELRRIARDLANKAKTIESERDSFKTKVDEQERKTRTNEENLQKDLEAERSANAALRAINAKLAILGAIRDDSRYEWHDPEMVAQQLNPDVVKVDADGRVENLKKELDRVAKDHEFLLKKKSAANTQGKQPNSGNGPTGFQPGQGGANNNGAGQPDLKELAKSYPALAGRF